MKVIVFLGGTLLCLAGCAHQQPQSWTRPDGTTPSSGDLQLAMTACRGEVQKAAVQGQAISTVNNPLGMDRQDRQIYEGCMAQHGYLAARGPPSLRWRPRRNGPARLAWEAQQRYDLT
jgi:hypothetical protein